MNHFVFVDTSAWLALINKTVAFTNDHHFEQMGFNILLKEE